MVKTTVHLPDDLTHAIECEARRRSLSKAEVVRQALREALRVGVPQPRGGLYVGREPIADRVDELLDRFGQELF